MRGAIPLADTYSGFSMPQAVFRKVEHIGRNKLDGLFRTGEVDSVVIGERTRHVILGSWRAYVARQMAGTERDPVEKARAIEAYRASVQRSQGARATALARSGWGPDHGKRGGSKHLTSRGAAAARRASPPKVAPKARSSKRQSIREENPTTV
jgi:hypothetical protein